MLVNELFYKIIVLYIYIYMLVYRYVLVLKYSILVAKPKRFLQWNSKHWATVFSWDKVKVIMVWGLFFSFLFQSPRSIWALLMNGVRLSVYQWDMSQLELSILYLQGE